MFQVKGLGKRYGGRELFSDLSFSIEKGERVGLLGRNGSGKSTCLRILTGQEEADEGVISYPKGYRIGFLTQHLKMTQKTVLEEGASGLPPERVHEEYKVEQLLEGLGFDREDFDRHPEEFSGGYQLRIHLVKVLVSEPDCLLLDEPTNYLDIPSIRWLEGFLSDWPGEMIIISHDRGFVDAVCDYKMTIHRKKVIKCQGSCEDLYQQILEEEEIFEKTRQNLEKKKVQLQSFVDRFGAKASKAAQAKSKAKAIARLPNLQRLVELQNLNFSFRYDTYTSVKVLEMKGIGFGYPGGESLFQDFSLLIERGQKLACIGKNGQGKTTLLHLMSGLLKPLEGEVFCGEKVKLGYFGQTHIDRLNDNLTVREEVQLSNPHLSQEDVGKICGSMMFSGGESKKKIQVLSGGERSRVLLGKILASSCNFLLLDEPSNHLDMESVEALTEALENFEGAVVIVSHDESLLSRIAERCIVFNKQGVEVFEGGYEDYLRKYPWEEEEPAPAKTTNKKKASLQEANLLQKEISRLEKKIQEVETNKDRVQNDYLQVVESNQSPDPQSLQEMTKKIHEICQELEKLYGELELKMKELRD